MQSLSIAATGMLAQQTNVDVIANNIANMTTTGFRRQRAEFQDLLYQDKSRPGAPSSSSGTLDPSGIQIGTGVRTAAVYRVGEQGPTTITDNPLDMAISGDGFFIIELPNGEQAYTRAGSMQMNANGEIVTADGYLVSPGVTIPQDTVNITINADGEVFAKLDGTIAPQNVGRVELANFPNEGGLDAIGNNLFLETPSSGSPTTSNPGEDVVAEITNMISAQRAYEMNSKVISASDEMLRSLNQLR